MSDFPFYEVAQEAEKQMNAGATIYQKFTCANCGSRQTMDEKNKFFMKGKCEECSHITDIVIQGCNFVAILGGK